MNEIIDTFANRLKKALLIRNIKPIELSEKTGIDKSKISSYINGRYNANQQTLQVLASALNVNPVWLIGYDVPMFTTSNISTQFYKCPVYGQIRAGQPNWAEECLEGYLPLDPNLMGIINPEECFFLRVNGESMNKVIRNGAYALIRKQSEVKNGEIAVVLVNSFEATLKRFNQNENIVVLSPNSNSTEFEPIIVDTSKTDLKILGKYIGKFEINK